MNSPRPLLFRLVRDAVPRHELIEHHNSNQHIHLREGEGERERREGGHKERARDHPRHRQRETEREGERERVRCFSNIDGITDNRLHLTYMKPRLSL